MPIVVFDAWSFIFGIAGAVCPAPGIKATKKRSIEGKTELLLPRPEQSAEDFPQYARRQNRAYRLYVRILPTKQTGETIGATSYY
jgi:hypothetical protein